MSLRAVEYICLVSMLWTRLIRSHLKNWRSWISYLITAQLGNSSNHWSYCYLNLFPLEQKKIKIILYILMWALRLLFLIFSFFFRILFWSILVVFPHNRKHWGFCSTVVLFLSGSLLLRWFGSCSLYCSARLIFFTLILTNSLDCVN